MKSYIINNIDGKGQDIGLKLIETAEELPVRRYLELKAYLIQKETGTNLPSLHESMAQFVKEFDNRSQAGMLITIYNYLTGLTAVVEGEDADQMLFSLIVVEEKEDVKNYSKTAAKEKMARFAELGLAQKEVIEVVENFLKGSQILSAFYSLMSSVSLKQPVTS